MSFLTPVWRIFLGALLLTLNSLVMARAQTWQRDPLLSQLLVKQQLFDATGFCWVATDEGVFRYDGYELLPLRRLLRPGGPPPPERLVQALALDAHGQLWIGAEAGLFCLELRTGRLRAVPLPALPGTTSPSITTLFCHPRSGQLWVAYGDNSLAVLEAAGPAYRWVGTPRRLGGGAYFFQPDGTAAGVWLSLRQANWPARAFYTDALQPAVLQLAPSGPPLRRIATHTYLVPVPGTAPLRLFSASAWFEAGPAGRVRELRRWLPAGNEDNFIPRMARDGRWHWASQGQRLCLTVRGPAAGQVLRDSLRLGSGPTDHRHSYVLAQDSLGGQWCYSQYWRGCYKQAPASRRQVQPLRLASGRPTPSTRGIARLPDGRLLVGAYGGSLTQAADSPNAPMRPLRVRTDDGRPLPLGFDLACIRGGQVLWAEEFRGFSWFDFRTDSLYALPYADARPGEVFGRAICLLEDSQGQCWGGGAAGLFRLDVPHRRALRYAAGPNAETAARQLRRLEITDMAEDVSARALWLVTPQGLYWLQPATGVLRRVGESGRLLPTDALLCVASAGPGRAWVGTRSEGLLLVDIRAGLLRQVSLAEGMPSNIVATVLRRPDGTVWAGTYAGLVRYVPATQNLTVLAEAQGLVDAELNRNSAYADPTTGALWFGGIGGLHRVLPAAAGNGASGSRARLLLTAVALPGNRPDAAPIVQPLRGGRVPALHLAAGNGAFVELRLALSNLLAPAQTHYAYRLRQAGGKLLSDWLPTPQRLVLRGLPAGDYLVEARAETATGQVAANLVRVPLHVDQEWWQHPLSWALGAGLLVFLVFGLFWLQGSRARRDIRLREELAANLHDEVGALLTRVTMQAELLRELGQGPPVRLAALVSDARAAATTVRDIIWSVDAAADTLGALVDRIRDYLDATAHATPLRINVVITGITDPARPLSPVVRQHLYLICKEAVTNALRHAQGATALTVTLHCAPPTLELHVHNDGTPGLAMSASRTGQGTRNMRNRARLLRAQLHAGPQAEGGWKVALRVTL